VALTFTEPEVVAKVDVPLISIEPGVTKLSLFVPDETLASTESTLRLLDLYGGMGGHGRTYSRSVYAELLRTVGGCAILETIRAALPAK
jgi:hypothetical protein